MPQAIIAPPPSGYVKEKFALNYQKKLIPFVQVGPDSCPEGLTLRADVFPPMPGRSKNDRHFSLQQIENPFPEDEAYALSCPECPLDIPPPSAEQFVSSLGSWIPARLKRTGSAAQPPLRNLLVREQNP